ncbi:MAG TPA: HAD family phosphatase [Gemmatimonadaceae bacterium]|jgi:putative hydrolase of the HAD superfamily
MAINHVFFDIGGVLGTNGWDREQRAQAVEHFGLDARDFQFRHEETVGALEEGRLSLEEYLDITVFHSSRAFSRDDFVRFICAQSKPYPDTIRIARALCDSGLYWMYTLNNECDALNRYRIDTFGIREVFDAFLSSCWLGVRKPMSKFYDHALGISQCIPEVSVFIDDREQNLGPARRLGMNTIMYESADQLQADLTKLGVTTTKRG